MLETDRRLIAVGFTVMQGFEYTGHLMSHLYIVRLYLKWEQLYGGLGMMEVTSHVRARMAATIVTKQAG